MVGGEGGISFADPATIMVPDIQRGGEGGIRTHGELAPTAVFKTAALNHSATHPHRPAVIRASALPA